MRNFVKKTFRERPLGEADQKDSKVVRAHGALDSYAFRKFLYSHKINIVHIRLFNTLYMEGKLPRKLISNKDTKQFYR